MINVLVDNLVENSPDEADNMDLPEKKLQEYLGHTPTQVFAGAVLGGVIAMFL